MSKAYAEKFGKKKIDRNAMRAYCMRPGKRDKDGNIVYTTEQHHKRECDVKQIIKKYDRTGLIIHTNRMEAQYGDLTGEDYKTMLDKVIDIRNKFDELPSEIRNRFKNSPEKYLEFMSDPKNREEAIKLGIINSDWLENEDGIGEHMTEEKQKERDERIESEQK